MKFLPLAGSVIMALLLNAAPIAGVAATAPAPAPTVPPMGYYIMQGKQIVSMPFSDVNACFKALQNIQKTVAPGNDTLVCAHRRP